MNRYVTIAAAAMVLIAALAAADDVFTADDGTRVQTAIAAAQKDGWWGSAERTFYAVSTLKSLSAAVPSKSSVCEKLAKDLAAADSAKATTATLARVSFGVRAAEAAGCDSVTVSDSLKKLLQKGLASAQLADVAHSVDAIAGGGAKRLTFDDFDVTKVVSAVSELVEDDGSARSGADEDDPSAFNAGRAMQVLGAVYKARHDKDNSIKEPVRAVGAKAASVIELGTGGESHGPIDFSASAPAGVSSVAAASTVLKGVNALAGALSEQLDLGENVMERLCEFFVSNKANLDLEEVYHVVSSLYTCANNQLRVPLVLRVSPASSATVAPTQVRITNVLDQFAAKAKVSLVKATFTKDDDGDSDGSTLLENADLTAAGTGSDNVVYSFADAAAKNKAWAAAGAGFYAVRFSVKPDSTDERFATTASRVTRRFKVHADITATKIEVFVADSTKSNSPSADSKTVSAAFSKDVGTVNAAAGKVVNFKLTLSPAGAQPAAVFVVLTSAKSGKQSVHVANPAGDNFSLKLDLGSAEVTESLSGSGSYSAEVVVGDALMAKPVNWKVATLELSGVPAPKPAVVAAIQARPDIAHSFRADDARPNRLLALTFVGLAALPLLYLLVKLAGTRLNFSLPTDPAELLSTVVFQGTLLAVLALYVVYWLGLTIFQALIGLTAFVPVLVLFGHRSLRARHQRLRAATEPGKPHAE